MFCCRDYFKPLEDWLIKENRKNKAKVSHNESENMACSCSTSDFYRKNRKEKNRIKVGEELVCLKRKKRTDQARGEERSSSEKHGIL